MRTAVAAAAAAGKPWALDPVGAGAIAARTATSRRSFAACNRRRSGGKAEILGLAGQAGGRRGVDTGANWDVAVEAAQRLANATHVVVTVTGAVDYVTDGTHVVALRNGHKMMASVTGMGCAASGGGFGTAWRSVATHCRAWRTRWR